MKITKQESEFLLDFLNQTGFEIWNAGCHLRMSASMADDGVKVCEYNNPLHGKEYKSVQAAINYMIKQDQS